MAAQIDPTPRTRWLTCNLVLSRPPFPKALLLTLAILLAVEWGAARRESFWYFFGGSAVNEIDYRQRQIVEPGPPPSVVLLGSSRVQLGIAPRVLESQLGVPRGSVYNLAMGAGTPFDALTAYRQGRAKLKLARWLVIGFDDFVTNANFGHNPRDQRYATLEERLHDYDPELRSSLLLGAVWRTADAQEPFRRLLPVLIGGSTRQMPERPDGRLGLPPTISPPLRDDRDEQYTGAVDKLMCNYAPGYGRLRQLQKLLDLTRADGVPTLVLVMPVNHGYLRVLRRQRPEALTHFQACLDQLPQDCLLNWMDSASVGLDYRDYYDYGHVTDQGVVKTTALLANELRRRAARP